MQDSQDGSAARRLLARAAGRLRRVRWLLAASIVSLVAAHLVGEGSFGFLVATILAVVFVAVVAPQGRPGRRAEAVQGQTSAAVGQVVSAVDGQALPAADLAAAVADPLIVFDASGFVRFANAAALRAFGEVEEGISLPLKFRSPEMQDLFERLQAGQTAPVTIGYAERVPVERAWRVTATAVGRGSGLFVMVFKDLSETRRIDRMRADFIANASHELRTPLASISGFVETLLGPARDDAVARERFLKIMQGQTARMARLIDDLLSLSHLEMKTDVADGRRIALPELVGSVAGALGPLAEESGVVLDLRLEGAGPEVVGDRDELFQVFSNLIENACKYGQGGGRVEITPAEGLADGEVGVVVRDFGPGIAEEHLPRLTERFYRVDAENSRSQKGTGLGLAIVKHILTRHGGRLDVRSTLGEGSQFVVVLPAAPR
jgi:two-component system phosphate regulon sensor histidine kinase PhoR